MIGYLGPLLSVFELLIKGLSKATDITKIKEKKKIQRKIIEIQVSLEDIIDNAQKLFLIIEKSGHISENDKEDLLREFIESLHDQFQRVSMFIDQFRDKTSDEILKLFTPDIRRNISLLVHWKMSALYQALWAINDTIEKTKKSKAGFKSTFEVTLLNWDHEKYVVEGEPYHDEFIRHRKRSQLMFSHNLEQQKEIIKKLIQCSKDFSAFIRANITIQDAIGLRGKRKA